MGALVGLGVGIGLLLVWSAFFLPAPAARTAVAARAGCAQLLARAGLGQVSVDRVRAALRRSAARWPALRDPGRLAARRRWRSRSG